MPGFIESVYLLLYKYMNDIIKGVYRLASNINWNLLNRFNCYKRLEPTLICLNIGVLQRSVLGPNNDIDTKPY